MIIFRHVNEKIRNTLSYFGEEIYRDNSLVF